MHWVKVTHPDLSKGNAATITLESFENLYEKKGWVLVEVEEIPEVTKPKSRTFEPSVGTASRPSKAKPKKTTEPDSEPDSSN